MYNHKHINHSLYKLEQKPLWSRAKKKKKDVGVFQTPPENNKQNVMLP